MGKWLCGERTTQKGNYIGKKKYREKNYTKRGLHRKKRLNRGETDQGEDNIEKETTKKKKLHRERRLNG